MINIIRLNPAKIILSTAVLIIAAIPLLSVQPAEAAVNAKLSLSPASKTITVGEDLEVYLMLKTGGNSVLAWKTTITYSTTAFSTVSVATDPSSHFTLNPATDVASGGTIKLSRYATSASSTDGAMAKITLRSTGVGNATLSFAHICSPTTDVTPCTTAVGSAGTNLLSTITNGSYTIAAVPINGSSSGGATAAPAKKKSIFGRISDTVASVISPSTEAQDVTASTVKAPRGTVQISVNDKKGNPLTGAKVTLAGVSAMTDRNGQVVLSGIYPGEAKGTITYNDKTQNFTLLVKSGTTLDSPQRLNLTFEAAGGSKVLPILAAIMGLAVIIGLIDLIFISKGGFKANIDKALHHGDGGSGTISSTNSSSRHSASFSRETNDHMTPGLIVEPSSKDTTFPWKH